MSRLLIIKGPNKGVSYLLTDRTRIGRLGENEIQVSDPNVSRIHAEVIREINGFTIYDRGSKNGIEVNGQAVAEQKLKAGDLINIGSASFLYDGSLYIQNARFSCSPIVVLEAGQDHVTKTELKTTKDTDAAVIAESINQILEQPSGKPDLLRRLSATLLATFDANYTAILTQDYFNGPLNPVEAAPRARHCVLSRQLLDECLESKQPVTGTLSPDWKELENLLELGDEPKPTSINLLMAPLSGPDGTHGAIIIARDDDREFNQAEAAALQIVTAIATLALQVTPDIRLQPQDKSGTDQKSFSTRSLRMQEIYNSARRAGPGHAPILITGEIGSGKETLAKFIHEVCERANGPFVVLKCPSIPSEDLERVLFGSQTTSPDGEILIQPGKIDEAAGGTLFLEEVGDLDLGFQPKLLRFIQDHAYARLGSDCAAMGDVKVIASSSKDLAASVRSGHFREDLWYRLNVVPFNIPPLRERREDIAPLLDTFIQEYATHYNRKIIGANDSTIALLQKYDWPGNIRELRNAVERAILLAESKVLSTSDFSHIEDARRQLNAKSDLERKRDTRPLAEVERQHIIIALKKHQYNQARAAEALGLHRNTLRNKIIEYGIEIPK